MNSCEFDSHRRIRNCLHGFFALLLCVTALPAVADLPDACRFADLELPADFAVFAAGEYSGRGLDIQIDQSGHQATQMDVTVNSPSKPVVLLLGAYEPTIWSIKWSRGTRILAVVVGGYHRQAVAGLPRNVPLMKRSYEENGSCGYFYVGSSDLRKLNPLSRQLFGRAVDMVYLAKNGSITAGDPPRAGEPLETSDDTPLESFVDRNGPPAGPAGLRDAVQKGLIRPATSRDVDDWMNAVRADTSAADIPPVAGQTRPLVERPKLFNAYVVLQPFTYPAGLFGGNLAVFFIPRGVPRPRGNPGHSTIYDFNSFGCEGALCESARNSRAIQPDAGNTKSGAAEARRCSSADDGASCLADELWRTDVEINNVYRNIMAGLDAAARKNLRTQQRTWIKSRNAACSLDGNQPNRQKWIAYVLSDKARAVCVVRMTKERLTQLSELDEPLADGRTPAEPLKIETTIKPARSNLDYMKSSTENHARGKWYFEIQVDHGKIRKELEASLFIGIQGEQTNFGTMYHIRPQDLVLEMGKGQSVTVVGGNLGDGVHLPKVTVGIAADLDNGKLYVRRDGQWRSGLPGSSTGIDVKLGRSYKASITSSVPMANLVEQGIVTVNFGDRTFADPVPDGYALFDSSSTAKSVRAGAVEILPPGSIVAGHAPAYWLRKQWEWLRAAPASAKPSADPTGARCADRQSGAVWFLTGSESRIPAVRSCDIPAGMYVLVPIVSSLAQLDPTKTASCPEMMHSIAAFTDEWTDLRFQVDGVALPTPTLYRNSTGCFELDDISRGVKGQAAGDGYWVFLKPMPPGKHEVSFGGRFKPDGFTQNINYSINVR